MKGNRIIKWMFALIVAAIIGFFGFVFKVNEGEYAVVTRFGAVRSEVTQAGMYLRLPWPFEDVQIQDARKRYLDSGYLETLTHDKKNVIMQTYTIWSIADPLRYYTSVGDTALAETYLSDLVTSAKNGTMGNYDLSALVSLDEEDIKIDEIEAAMLQEVQSHALEQYGIQVHELRLKRVGLPATNVQSVFTRSLGARQMRRGPPAWPRAGRRLPPSTRRRSGRWQRSMPRPTARTQSCMNSYRSWLPWRTRWTRTR